MDKPKKPALFDCVEPALVEFVTESNQDDAIRVLVDRLYDQKKLTDKEAFYNAIIEREKIVTTAIGMNVAIPHAKLHNYKDFFIAIGIVIDEGIEWSALDGSPVRLIFMIGGPDDKQTEYLQILSSLTHVLKDEKRRKSLLSATSPDKVIQIFEGF